jgi:hypothetical protein
MLLVSCIVCSKKLAYSLNDLTYRISCITEIKVSNSILDAVKVLLGLSFLF